MKVTSERRTKVRSRRQSTLWLALVLAIGSVAGAEGEAKDPGDPAPARLSPEQRIEARLEHAVGAKQAHSSDPAEAPTYSVDGAESAELLLPQEIFAHLLSIATAEDPRFRENFRLGVSESRAEIDGPSFWAFVDRAWVGFESIGEQRLRLAGGAEAGNRTSLEGEAIEQEDADLARQECRLRFELLREAREQFGDEELDQLLYSVIAPQMALFAPIPVDMAAERRRLAWIEGGCP